MSNEKIENEKPSESSDDLSSSSLLSESVNADMRSNDMAIFGQKDSSSMNLPDLQIDFNAGNKDGGKDHLNLDNWTSGNKLTMPNKDEIATPYGGGGGGSGGGKDKMMTAAERNGDKPAHKSGVLESSKESSADATKAAPKPDTPPFSEREKTLDRQGMEHKPSEDHGNATVYEPKNGKTDIHGRSKVEVIHHGEKISHEIAHYPDGRKVEKGFDKDGNLEHTTATSSDGKKVTTYPGITENASTMAAAFKNEGAEGLKREIDAVLKKSNNDWSKVDKMLKELNALGIETRTEGNKLIVNDGWTSDSQIGTRPGTSTPAPEAPQEVTPAPSGVNPAAKGFVPSWWAKDVTDALNKSNK